MAPSCSRQPRGTRRHTSKVSDVAMCIDETSVMRITICTGFIASGSVFFFLPNPRAAHDAMPDQGDAYVTRVRIQSVTSFSIIQDAKPQLGPPVPPVVR